jgi:hypothetical protein
LLGACKDEAKKPAPVASASASTAASASAAPPAGPPEYAGSYTATAGTLYVPDAAEWKGVKFRGDDAGALGEGTITFTLDPDAGTLAGNLEGPLGPATISGVSRDGALSFHVAPREKTDMAFSGTGTGTLDGGSASGELHVSSWRANVLRDATFTATPKKK